MPQGAVVAAYMFKIRDASPIPNYLGRDPEEVFPEASMPLAFVKYVRTLARYYDIAEGHLP